MKGQDKIVTLLCESQESLQNVLALQMQLLDQVDQSTGFRFGIVATHVAHALAEVELELTKRRP